MVWEGRRAHTVEGPQTGYRWAGRGASFDYFPTGLELTGLSMGLVSYTNRSKSGREGGAVVETVLVVDLLREGMYDHPEKHKDSSAIRKCLPV